MVPEGKGYGRVDDRQPGDYEPAGEIEARRRFDQETDPQQNDGTNAHADDGNRQRTQPALAVNATAHDAGQGGGHNMDAGDQVANGQSGGGVKGVEKERRAGQKNDHAGPL